jgi:TetR/AcrR family transcriptional repressor of nem operon
MSLSSKEAILAATRRTAQAHGYSGLNFRELANEVGIKAASIHYHFPSKADLGAAVAKRYWEDSAAVLEALWAEV